MKERRLYIVPMSNQVVKLLQLLNEHEFNHDVIEKQLAHVVGNKTRGVYNHAQYLDQRREIMQWFADYIDKISGVKW